MSGRPDWTDCLYRPSTFCDAERGEGRAAPIFRHEGSGGLRGLRAYPNPARWCGRGGLRSREASKGFRLAGSAEEPGVPHLSREGRAR